MQIYIVSNVPITQIQLRKIIFIISFNRKMSRNTRQRSGKAVTYAFIVR